MLVSEGSAQKDGQQQLSVADRRAATLQAARRPGGNYNPVKKRWSDTDDLVSMGSHKEEEERSKSALATLESSGRYSPFLGNDSGVNHKRSREPANASPHKTVHLGNGSQDSSLTPSQEGKYTDVPRDKFASVNEPTDVSTTGIPGEHEESTEEEKSVDTQFPQVDGVESLGQKEGGERSGNKFITVSTQTHVVTFITVLYKNPCCL